MTKRAVGYLLGAAVLVGGVGYGLDLLIETDEERVAMLVDDITGEITAARIDRGLAWVDPEAVPVTVEAYGISRVFEDRDTLRTQARRSLRVLMGQELRTVSRRVVVQGDAATVRLRLWGARGVSDLEFGLRKRDERWLIHRLTQR